MSWQKKDRCYIRSGTTYINIQGFRVRENYTKLISKVDIPSLTGTPDKLVLDFNKLDYRITIDGYIMTTTSEMSDVDVSTVATKKANIKTINQTRGVVYVKIRDEDEVAMFLEKAEVDDVVAQEENGDPSKYKVIFTLLDGRAP